MGVQASGEGLALACEIWGASPMRPGAPRRGAGGRASTGLLAASKAEMSMALFVRGHQGGFHKQLPVCTSQVCWAPRGAGQGTTAPPDQAEDWPRVPCR